MEHDHTPEGIRERLRSGPKHSYLRDWVYGGIDGAVTTFAIVSGVVGAQLPSRTILILGLANLIADGFSMAASNYLGTRAEHHELEHFEDLERRHVRQFPEGEREEVRQILREKGFSGQALQEGVEALTRDKARWVRFMLTEEYGLPASIRSPWLAGAATYLSFLLCGAVPLIPFVLGASEAFSWAVILTGLVFFLIGSMKSRWSIEPWWRSGMVTFAVGAVAAAIAYGIGWALRGEG